MKSQLSSQSDECKDTQSINTCWWDGCVSHPLHAFTCHSASLLLRHWKSQLIGVNYCFSIRAIFHEGLGLFCNWAHENKFGMQSSLVSHDMILKRNEKIRGKMMDETINSSKQHLFPWRSYSWWYTISLLTVASCTSPLVALAELFAPSSHMIQSSASAVSYQPSSMWYRGQVSVCVCQIVVMPQPVICLPPACHPCPVHAACPALSPHCSAWWSLI